MLKGNLVAQYKQNKHIYRGAIHGGNISFSSVLKDTGNDDRHFLCRSLEINDKRALADGEWIELYESTLDDGTIPGVGEADFDSTDFDSTDWVTD